MEDDILEVLNKQKVEKSNASMTEMPVHIPTEKPNFESYFKLNNWVDARDQLNVWRLGKIKKLSGFFLTKNLRK